MFKKKFLLAAILTAPLFTMTSCNQGTVKVTLDAGIGMFVNGESCRTMNINKGSSLFTSLGQEIPFAGGTGDDDDILMYPIYWTKGSKTIVHWNDGINATMTLHAHYFSSVQDAQDAALGKIGSACLDACARQPEAIDKITKAYEAAAKHVANATSEGGAIGMGKVGGSEMDACARQPEAINKISSVAEHYFTTLETGEKSLSNNLGAGIGKIGSIAMDACARQPEAIERVDEKDLTHATLIFTKTATTLPSYSGLGLGKFGSGFMDACGRQPEAIGKLLEKTSAIFNGFSKAKNSMQTYNIGKASYAWADACGRQPEKINAFFDELVKNINDILNS